MKKSGMPLSDDRLFNYFPYAVGPANDGVASISPSSTVGASDISSPESSAFNSSEPPIVVFANNSLAPVCAPHPLFEPSNPIYASPREPASVNLQAQTLSTALAPTALPSRPANTETADISGSTSTSATLSVNSSAKGQVSFWGDHDWYKVNLVSGNTYSFAAIGTGLNAVSDTYLKLRDGSGNILRTDNDSGPGESSVIGMAGYGQGKFIAPYTGAYFIDVSANSFFSTGQYGVSVTQSLASNGYKPSFDVLMGAGALHTDPSSGSPNDWNQVLGTTRGEGVNLTYSFRESVTYTTTGKNASSTFSKVTATEMWGIHNILKLYSEICNVTFTPVKYGGYSNNAQIVISNYYDKDDTAGAFAYFPDNQRGGDLWLNTASVNPNNIIQGQYSWFAIAHELGHALGLSHPGDYNAGVGSPTYTNSAQFVEDSEQYSIMSYWGGNVTGAAPGFFATASTPLMFDIYEMQTLYGPNFTTRANNNTYGFNTNAGDTYLFKSTSAPYYCIWDGGGIDTIDASQYTQAQYINLSAGTFSNIGGGIKNISIALGAVIENAVGGSNGDTILGNDADNMLDGRGGADMLVGDAGDDLYLIDLNSAGGFAFQDTVIETPSAGTDTIQLRGFSTGVTSLKIPENVENLDASGTGSSLLNLTGNALKNKIIGNAAPNVIVGGAGADNLDGRDNSDIYVIDSVADYASGEVIKDTGATGIDEIRFTSTVASTLVIKATTAGIEKIVVGTGVAAAATLTGTTPLNVDASSISYGITIIGNSGSNVFTGGIGNDMINGGAGADTIIGGRGNDSITLAESGSSADTVIFRGGIGTSGSLARVGSLGLDTITGMNLGTATSSIDKVQFSAADFGIAAGTMVVKGGLNTDGNFYIRSTGPTSTAVDLNGTSAANGAAIVFAGAATGTSGITIYFTTSEGVFSTTTAVKVATLIGISTSMLNTTDLAFIA